MVNNSTNINKTKNHLLRQNIDHSKDHLPHVTLEIKVLSWDRHKHVGDKLVYRIPTISS